MSFEVEAIMVSPQACSEPTVEAHDEGQRFNESLSLGIKAAQAGDRAKARTLLTAATDIDPSSENAWLWLASISEYPEELIVFLNHVLEINPDNEKAISWSRSAKSLIARNLIQRANDAAADGLRELAVQCFDQAVEYEPQNETAWLGLASLADSELKKLAMLERVLAINPQNSEALSAVRVAHEAARGNLLSEARHAAAQGSFSVSHVRLDELLSKFPDCKEAWELRSHITTSLKERRAAYEKLLEIDPENVFARAGVESLRNIFDATLPAAAYEPESEKASEIKISKEHIVLDVTEAHVASEELPIETIDTGDLILPEEFSLAAGSESNSKEMPDAIELNAVLAEQPVSLNSSIKDWSYSAPDTESSPVFDESHSENIGPSVQTHAAPTADTESANGEEVSAYAAPSPWKELASELDKAVEIEIPEMDSNFQPESAPNTTQLPEELEISAAPAFATTDSDDQRDEFEHEDVPPAQNPHAGYTVMVVDDNPVIRKLISGKLEECGYMVVCAEDGRTATSMIKQSVPDLILLDITLPQMDGYEVCRAIRTNPAAKDIPVVMISGRDGYYEDFRGKSAGASGFITKPFGPETLMRTVEGHLRTAAPVA